MTRIRTVTPRRSGPLTRESRARQTAERLLAENREEMARADVKARHGLTVAGATAGAVFGTVAGNAWSPYQLDTAHRWIWWIGCALWSLGVLGLTVAMFPRLGGGTDTSQLAYFGHVRRLGQHRLAEALRRSTDQPMPGLISELHWTSSTILIKYHFVRFGMVCLALAIVSLVVAVV